MEHLEPKDQHEEPRERSESRTPKPRRSPRSVFSRWREEWKKEERVAAGTIASGLKGAFKGAAGIGLAIATTAAAVFVLLDLTLHILRPEHMIIVQPFEASEASLKKLGLTGKSASDIVIDEFNSNVNNAMAFRGYQSSSGTTNPKSTRGIPNQLHYGSIRKLLKIPIQSSYGIEVNGISLDSLLKIYDRIRYETWEISGDLVGTEDFQAISVRMIKKGSATQWYRPLSGSTAKTDEAEAALRNAADRVLETWDPEMMTRALLQEGKFKDATRVAKNWLSRDYSNRDSAFYLVLAEFFDGLQCIRAECPEQDALQAAHLDFESSLALANRERADLGKPSILERFALLRPKIIAHSERDRLDSIIADIELEMCRDDPLSSFDFELEDARKKYSVLIGEYGGDENIAVNDAAVELIGKNAKGALAILDNYQNHHVVDGIFYLAKAAVSRSLNDSQSEIDAYRQALQANPENPAAEIQFMDALTDRALPKDSTEAIVTYRWLLAEVPLDQNPRVAIDLSIDYARALAETGDFNESADALKPVLKNLSTAGTIQFAEMLKRNQKYTVQALTVIQEKIDVTNQAEVGAANMASLYQEAAQIERALGHLPEAKAYTRKAIAAQSKNGHMTVVNIVVAPKPVSRN